MLLRVFALLGCAAVGFAQAPDVVGLARKAPPELFADAVIHAVESGEIPSAEARRDFLAEAFEAAKHAKEAVRLIAITGLPPDSRAMLRDAAGGLKLDALSLQTRVIALVAKVDADKAREMFESIEHPKLERRPCEDPMIADASAYYETAGAVDRAELLRAVAQASLPSEFASFAKVLSTGTPAAPEELKLLLGALALKMGTAGADYRSFAMTAQELQIALEKLEMEAREAEIPRDNIALAVRKFIVTQIGSAHCHEEYGQTLAFADWFNRRFRIDLDPIREQDTWSDNNLGAAKAGSYFSSGDAAEIADQFQQLRMKLGAAEWPKALASFLVDFAAWKPSGAAIDVFHQRMTVLHGLYQMIPPGEDRDRVAAQAVEVLRSGTLEREYPAEWWLQVRSFAQAAMNGQAQLVKAFRESGDAGLVLFAAETR